MHFAPSTFSLEAEWEFKAIRIALDYIYFLMDSCFFEHDSMLRLDHRLSGIYRGESQIENR